MLGAGFSVDATSEAGNPDASGHPVGYPLVSDLGSRCFGLETLPPQKSIEELFQKSIESHNLQPIEKLYEFVMEADFYITPYLCPDGQHADNVYLRFLRDFPSAPLLTFNYDSLPEILLLALRSWRPEDGYGVPVKVQVASGQDTSLVPIGHSRAVLHLHGSSCVYSIISEIESRHDSKYDMLRLKDEPDFLFDPDALGHCFSQFERYPPGHGYTHVSNRLIAPVPDKTEGLKGEFIRTVYSKAMDLVSRATEIVVIGYSFNPHDHASYNRLLAAATKRRVLLVAPDARSLVKRLAKNHPDINWTPSPLSFRKWVLKDYPGVLNSESVV